MRRIYYKRFRFSMSSNNHLKTIKYGSTVFDLKNYCLSGEKVLEILEQTNALKINFMLFINILVLL